MHRLQFHIQALASFHTHATTHRLFYVVSGLLLKIWERGEVGSHFHLSLSTSPGVSVLSHRHLAPPFFLRGKQIPLVLSCRTGQPFLSLPQHLPTAPPTPKGYPRISPGTISSLRTLVKTKISTLHNLVLNSSVFSSEKTNISCIQQVFFACLFYARLYCQSWESSRE